MELKGTYIIVITLLIIIALLAGLSLVGNTSGVDNPYNMVKHDAYLYEADFNNLDYNAGYKYFKNVTFENLFSCSSFYKDGLYGRSLDWIYDNSTTLVMHVNGTKHKSLAIGSYGLNQQVSEDIINGVDNHSEVMKIIPFVVYDGLNDAGVTCNINVVPHNDLDSYSVAKVETKHEICTFMLGRFILDNFGSAKEAAEYIRDYCDVYQLGDVTVHIMIADTMEKIM